ncbi:terpene synthase family protein [Nonomuraea diastatica]|uniref:Terpene synthase n=1 Tax=Nonomuraea diastatica TaxID=1848329 RepID=A0A4R4W991_9ACTN|nr:terpene synthase family protein [Nonomuraea diastatica]TDD13617.1 terpene synthase [Nonomuraea diastatica]
MSPSPSLPDELSSGGLSARAAECARDLRRTAACHPELFDTGDFADTPGQVANMMVYGTPRHGPNVLRSPSQLALWIFPLDAAIDRDATQRSQVRAIVEACKDVIAGDDPHTPLARLLADIRDDLAHAPAFGHLGPVWRTESAAMLDAMAREWEWKTAARQAAAAPTLEEYLGNAANFGSTCVGVCRLISTDEPEATREHLPAIIDAANATQRVMRLVNDLRTFERDCQWTDLNARMLGLDEHALLELITEERQACDLVLDRLAQSCPGVAGDLRHQMMTTWGFYLNGSDFWTV